MKKRKTVDRWLFNIIGGDKLRRRADAADRRIDHRVGAQLNSVSEKAPETDWRRLQRMQKEGLDDG